MLVKLFLILHLLLIIIIMAVSAVKQLGSICDPQALTAECGHHARCHPVQKSCGGVTIGVCLCKLGYRQQLPSADEQLYLLNAHNTTSTQPYNNYNNNQSNVANYWSSYLGSFFTDCQPIAKLGQRCRLGPNGPVSLDTEKTVVLPDGAVCDYRTSQIRCSTGTMEENGKCVDSLGKRTHGERCGERIASVTSCDASKRLSCLPAQPWRRCQCSPGFVWRTIFNEKTNSTTSTCVLVGIGETCDNSFECNVAQYRSHHSLVYPIDKSKLPSSIATCDADTRRCRCDETQGFLPASYVVPNVNVTVRRRLAGSDQFHYESVLLRVELVYSRRHRGGRNGPQVKTTPFVTETRCVAASAVSQISGCGEECSLDIESASVSKPIAVCQRGLTCHYCPSTQRSQCTRITTPHDEDDNEFQLEVDDDKLLEMDCCDGFFSKRPVFLWLSASVTLLLSAVVVAGVTILLVRYIRKQRRNRKMADDIATAKAASLALLETSSTQVPQVWATFKITPWRT